MPLRIFVLFLMLFNTCSLNGYGLPALALENLESEQSKNSPTPTLLLKPGQPLVTGMQTEDIVATYDVALAKQQVAAFPDSPEASFVLAVALTRTSDVEDALHEVRRARKLAEGKGGPAYFDHMISEYEEMLKSYPDDNRVRYGLAWAYYMKAYVLTHYAKPVIKMANNGSSSSSVQAKTDWHQTWVQSLSKPNDSIVSSKSLPTSQAAGRWGGLPPEMVPQVKNYYESALHNLDDLLAREPKDMWARAYRAFLYADYTGDISQSMDAWKACLALAPNNPAAYFFLGESYLQQGNLKECIHNISKAVALRGLPN